ncbi:MAG: aldehyde dehydrogenase family protein [Bacteroidales bacterium]|nr:aldehyde dehydrogenase family protein [Bacteroidales bacterium]
MTDKFGMKETLERLGLTELNSGATTGTEWFDTTGKIIESYAPADGELIGKIQEASKEDYEKIMETAKAAFKIWREVPAPKRGEIVRQMGEELRKYKADLGRLVSYEMGKIYQEGLGEVQEMIDIADFAVGQSRQLYGYTMQSEREKHRMFDHYEPLGVVGVISAFNFPVAVWAWNTMLALIAGDTVVWKPSSKTPLCAVATQNIMANVLRANNLPEGIINLVIAGSKVLGTDFIDDKRMPLISVTGSVAIGRKVASRVGQRLGKTILELGGNNAIIVSKEADLDMALRAIVFGAVGTAGQRCTSTRRLFIQEDIYDAYVERIVNAYKGVSEKIGHSLDSDTLVGPLIDKSSVEAYTWAIGEAEKEGGKVLFGNKVLSGKGFETGTYVLPTIIEAKNEFNIVQEETFAPILYVMKFKDIDEAIQMHNDVPQGLSSAIFSRNMLETEKFISAAGSDCGIANVNIGTSGAEIGGAFGGEKDTGGGRESGSDSWKIYMRRQTTTINFGTELPLAQGIKFDF